MTPQDVTRSALAAGATALAGAAAVAADRSKVDRAAVDAAFDALKTYDWGTDRNVLNPIDEAVVVTHGDAAARGDLEKRLVRVLESGTSRSAKDFVCRTLRTIGTADSVPALAILLPDKDLSHMARYALQSVPAPEAAVALRDALPNVSGKLKVGVIGSLGVRRDAGSVDALVGALAASDAAVACAAAHALAAIGNPAAGLALSKRAKKAPEPVKSAITDACLACAERLLADGSKTESLVLYQSLNRQDQPKHVRLAAKRGLLAVAGKKD